MVMDWKKIGLFVLGIVVSAIGSTIQMMEVDRKVEETVTEKILGKKK